MASDFSHSKHKKVLIVQWWVGHNRRVTENVGNGPSFRFNYPWVSNNDNQIEVAHIRGEEVPSKLILKLESFSHKQEEKKQFPISLEHQKNQSNLT